MKANKKGTIEISQLITYGTTFLLVAVILGIGAKTLNKAQGQLNSGATDNTTNDIMQNGSKAVLEMATWLPTIAIVIAAAVIIGLTYVFLKGGD